MNPKLAFNLSHSALIRIWHWLTFSVLIFSLFTVLIGNTLLKGRENVNLVKNSLKESGVTVTDQQARGVAHEFHDLIWTWHKIVGYGLIFLLFSRFIIEFLQSRHERILVRMKDAKNAMSSPGADIDDLKHFILVNWAYILFFLLLAFMGLTGLGMAYEDDVPWLDHMKHFNHTVHGYGQYLIYTYVVLHIGGAVMADIKKHKGLISGMINGNQ